MNDLQLTYQRLYAKVTEIRKAGQDVAGNDEVKHLRDGLRDLWKVMTITERMPFLAPGTHDRVEERECKNGGILYKTRRPIMVHKRSYVDGGGNPWNENAVRAMEG
jgi:hypothetical protein